MAMWNNQMVSFARTGDTSRSPSVFLKVYLRLASFADLTVQWGVILGGILANMALCQVWNRIIVIWVWINTYRYIFSGMNIHLPAILMFTRGTRVLTHPHMSKWYSATDIPKSWVQDLKVSLLSTDVNPNCAAVSGPPVFSILKTMEKPRWNYGEDLYNLRSKRKIIHLELGI